MMEEGNEHLSVKFRSYECEVLEQSEFLVSCEANLATSLQKLRWNCSVLVPLCKCKCNIHPDTAALYRALLNRFQTDMFPEVYLVNRHLLFPHCTFL
ncbi:hypothetical protein TNCT_198111 [Trichonephila clavata]|uniref:Uncharacterized protein n=1 Tax=Trichonephila clavata TaxID=2740835 RepID=A0A8X6IMW5_TRICU|nr:hypothetical protein TNCT_198111 [Trichonephila clavata]